MNAKQVGERVKLLRESKGLKKNALANASGVSPTYVNDIEAGRKCPTVEVLGYICDGLGVTLAEFFAQTQNTTKQHSTDTLTDSQKQLLNDFLKSL